MNILVLGYDGYIGWPLTLELLKDGHIVSGIDNGSRRFRVTECGSQSLTPILTRASRWTYLRDNFDKVHLLIDNNISHMSEQLKYIFENYSIDVIFHLAEQPSAPWSMANFHRANKTQIENVSGTLALLWAMKEACPKAHLIKIGTMGEYGTPNCDIPEGRIEEGPMAGLLFPRTAGSFYHLSKVHDTHNIEFACRNWGLRSTDIMQGVVFGLNETDNDAELTRFDYDEYFGTVINRFCVQAIIGHPLTVYGYGGQTRGFIPLRDSIKCLKIAMDNPPVKGEYRTFNQFESIHTINELAYMVRDALHTLNMPYRIDHIPNPRKESEDHYYNPRHLGLAKFGYSPSISIHRDIYELIKKILPYKDRVIKEVIMPKTTWK